jgi:hypothetical protein
MSSVASFVFKEFRKNFRMNPSKIAANKKWAMSPLISPPAGAVTEYPADKLVCMVIIRRFAAKFNHHSVRRSTLRTGQALKDSNPPLVFTSPDAANAELIERPIRAQNRNVQSQSLRSNHMASQTGYA